MRSSIDFVDDPASVSATTNAGAAVDYMCLRRSNCGHNKKSSHALDGRETDIDGCKTPCFRILDLHPELRNHIYDILIAHDAVHRPAFFALTQTCRQIRSELRPLFLAKVPAHVPYDQFQRFLEDFFPMAEVAALPGGKADVVVRLLLHIRTLSPASTRFMPPELVEHMSMRQTKSLRPLIRLHHEFPNIKISFAPSASLAEALNHVFENGLYSGVAPHIEDMSARSRACITNTIFTFTFQFDVVLMAELSRLVGVPLGRPRMTLHEHNVPICFASRVEDIIVTILGPAALVNRFSWSHKEGAEFSVNWIEDKTEDMPGVAQNNIWNSKVAWAH